jgi:hypothetical protein
MRAIRPIPLAELSNRLNLMIAIELGAIWAAVLSVNFFDRTGTAHSATGKAATSEAISAGSCPSCW